MDSYEVIISGHLCLDLIPDMKRVKPDDLVSSGRLFEIGALAYSTGGSVSNTGLALHQLGVKTGLMAGVGDDLIGTLIIQIIEDYGEGLSRLLRRKSDLPGSYTVVLSPSGADRSFLHCAGTNEAFNVEDVNFALLKDAKIFHLGYPPILPHLYQNEGENLEAIYRQAKATGVVTSMDLSLPDASSSSGRADWKRILDRALRYVDVFVPSIEEILFCLRRTDYENWKDDILSHVSIPYLSGLADDLLDMGAVITGFKLGRLGLYLKTGDSEPFKRLERLELRPDEWAKRELYAPAFEVDVAGTTGAGDAAYAGFLAALLRGLTPQEAVQMANAVGACNVERPDATSGVRSWDATRARIEAGWPTRKERIAESTIQRTQRSQKQAH